MLNIKLDKTNSIAILEPEGELTEADFRLVCDIIDPYLEQSGRLNGIIIHVQTFPGWDSFSAFITHLKFVKSHHKRIAHVALVTDSVIGSFAEHIADHFVNAKVKHFSFDEFELSVKWISEK